MYLEIEIDRQALIQSLRSLNQDDLCNLLIELDLMVADAGFTEDLVRALVKSLKADREDVQLPFIDWEKV